MAGESDGSWVLRMGHSDKEKASHANLGTSLHRVPQLTVDVRGILIGQAERLLLDQGGKDRSVWVPEALKFSCEHTVEFYSVIKKKKAMSYAGKQMELGSPH